MRNSRSRPSLFLPAFFLAALLAGTAPGQEAAAPRTDWTARWQGLAAKVFERQKALTRQAACDDANLARARLAVEKADLLLRFYMSGQFRDQVLQDEMNLVDKYLAAPASLTPNPIKGFFELAYLSALDMSPQPYALYVPTRYDDKQPLPMVVFLHGYAGDLNKVNWIEYMYSPTLQEVCERLGFVALLPYGRSNTEFMGIGESDVLHAIAQVKARVKIDESRVVLSGASMGGSGSYTIACHYPHAFAGVFTITGRVDYYLWMQRPREQFPRFKQVQTDMDYSRDLLGNLLHVPVFIGHGRLDHLLGVEQSRLMERLLRERKQAVEYVEFPDGSHYIWSDVFLHPKLHEGLAKWRVPSAPKKIQYRTYTLKYNRAYWAAIDALDVWGEPADLTVEVETNQRLRVACANVNAFTLRPPAALVERGKPVEVVVNGQPRTVTAGGEGELVCVLKETPAAPLAKTPTLCGPAREAYDGPFIIVVPTQGGDRCRDDAANAHKVAREWAAFAQGTPAVKKDTEITDADARDFHLVLCGGPETNAVLGRMADKLPIRIETEAYVVGERRFARRGRGLIMIYPNPLNPKRYVLVREGVLWGRSLSANHKLDLVPDFIIYREEVDRDGTMFETNQFECAGYFDPAWRLSERSTWVGKAEPAEIVVGGD